MKVNKKTLLCMPMRENLSNFQIFRFNTRGTKQYNSLLCNSECFKIHVLYINKCNGKLHLNLKKRKTKKLGKR